MPTLAPAARAASYATTDLSLFPTLPAGMQRSQVADLLLEVAPAIRLSAARLQALLAMISYTRPQAWVDPDEEPVCFASQVELAAKLGLTPRAVRSHERALSHKLGLIEKRTAANGSRSRSGELGLVFSRLIALVPQLLALAERRRIERSQVQSLVRKRSSYFRHMRDGLIALHPSRPDDPELGAVRDAVLAWPGSGQLRGMGLDALEAHVAEARALCATLTALAEAPGNPAADLSSLPDDPLTNPLFCIGMRPKPSGREDETFRSHIQDTTQEPLDFCSSERAKRPAASEHPVEVTVELMVEPAVGTTADPVIEPATNPQERQDAFVARLGPRRLYELAGEDMRFCLDMAGRSPERLVPLDFVTAAIHLLPHLGISGAAWEDAVETMGDFRAALCVLITDANRTHPVTPIRSPGGHLRALTQRHRAGQLNLVGSLIGLAERRDAE